MTEVDSFDRLCAGIVWKPPIWAQTVTFLLVLTFVGAFLSWFDRETAGGRGVFLYDKFVFCIALSVGYLFLRFFVSLLIEFGSKQRSTVVHYNPTVSVNILRNDGS